MRCMPPAPPTSKRPPEMWPDPSTIAGLILLAVFVAMVASIGACAGCDREWFGLDDESIQ